MLLGVRHILQKLNPEQSTAALEDGMAYEDGAPARVTRLALRTLKKTRLESGPSEQREQRRRRRRLSNLRALASS